MFHAMIAVLFDADIVEKNDDTRNEKSSQVNHDRVVERKGWRGERINDRMASQ